MNYRNFEHTLAAAPFRKVYLWDRKAQVWIESELYDQIAKDSNGKIPPELHITCPWCDTDLRVSGDNSPKDISVEYLDRPRKLRMPEGEIVEQTCLVTVHERVKCSAPSAAGKGLCAWGGYIKENRIYR